MKVLIAGWFSFEKMGATAGDLIARDLVGNWLTDVNIKYDIALAPPFKGGVNWQTVESKQYTDVIFICGPFGNGWPITDFLPQFSHARIIGVNLTMLQSLEEWNPFDFLLERDSSRACHPDITFCGPPPKIPVVGIILAHKQKEYRKRALHEIANSAIQRLTDNLEIACVNIDTALVSNNYGLRTPGEVESLISKMDVVITTRLHGTVLSLKNGVPPIPIDPISGGAKITKQVQTLGWPILFNPENLDDQELKKAFEFCLTTEAKTKINYCVESAVKRIEANKNYFIQQVLKYNNK